MKDFTTPNIILSKCIEHDNCRYNGSKINNDFIKTLKSHVNFVTVCPETSIGLSTPRDALRLVSKDDKENFNLVFSKTGDDLTDKMHSFSNIFLKDISDKGIDGFILKSRSPSCGIKNVKVYKSHGKSPALPKRGSGLFASKIYEYFPDAVIEDEGRLTNFDIREHFLTKIYTKSDFKNVKKDKSIKSLIDFQSKNKYLLMSHSPGYLKKMGKLTANTESKDISDIISDYEIYLNKALSIPSKPNRNINMLLHLFGYFSKHLSFSEKAFFLETLEKYNNKKIPFCVPLTMINSWVMRFENEYLHNQTIFEPFPSELIQTRDSGKTI
ncbi:YbgA family protein [Tepidibacter aestuarii]|uniref:YbgA family protein n=1 Tax=Tepidibacter aestuarii TaxID=2925782 RepID=UPI0020BDC982|nr:DUF523 and DUF1722 domain-containing protein [Tepidibacter aestuarii]CAH2212544.1 conserved protein of unknown function [Tepidibacter aestuarii]